MAKKKKKSRTMQVPLSPGKYIRSRCRNLPIGECWINKDWQEDGISQIFITREHSNNNVTLGIYMVDTLCMGVKESFYKFNISMDEFKDDIESFKELGAEKVDYVLVHNIIYGAIGYAEDNGFAPHSEFTKTTQFILEEDDDNIELIELEFGFEGKPLLIITDEDEPYIDYIRTLERTVGAGNFEFMLPNDEGSVDPDDDDDEEENDDINFLIRYYDDELEDRILNELDAFYALAEDGAKPDENTNDFLEETYHRVIEEQFAKICNDDDVADVIEFGDKLVNIDYNDNYEDNYTKFGITDIDDIDTYKKAEGFLYEGQPKKALKMFNKLDDIYPDTPNILSHLAFALILTEKVYEGEQLIKESYIKHHKNIKIKIQYLDYLVRHDAIDEFESILDDNFFLQDIFPEIEKFNIEDTIFYLKTLFRYFINTNQILKARIIFYILDNSVLNDGEIDILHKALIAQTYNFLDKIK